MPGCKNKEIETKKTWYKTLGYHLLHSVFPMGEWCAPFSPALEAGEKLEGTSRVGVPTASSPPPASLALAMRASRARWHWSTSFSILGRETLGSEYSLRIRPQISLRSSSDAPNSRNQWGAGPAEGSAWKTGGGWGIRQVVMSLLWISGSYIDQLIMFEHMSLDKIFVCVVGVLICAGVWMTTWDGILL